MVISVLLLVMCGIFYFVWFDGKVIVDIFVWSFLMFVFFIIYYFEYVVVVFLIVCIIWYICKSII